MVTIFIVTVLGLLGLVFGSFAGAQVWRLRALQLVEDKAAGESYDKKEYKALMPLTKQSLAHDRSRCLSCGHTLQWYDLLPLVSWIRTGGKCRYCRHPIGRFEPLIEVGTAAFFAISFLSWPVALASPLAITQFVVWLVAGVMLVILFAYDTKWFLLPDRVVFPLMGVALGYNLLGLIGATEPWMAVADTAAAIVILSGLYLVLWLISRGRWIGFGDVKLGVILGLLTGSWQLAFLTLFLANLIGTLIVIPGLITKKMTRTTQVPFGPMLIGACVIAVLYGNALINWYLSTFI